MRRWMKLATLAIVMLGAAASAHAALLEMIVTGTFGQGITYNNGPTSIDLSNQAFTMAATFDSTTGLQVGQIQAYQAITTTMQTALVNGGAAQTVAFATVVSPFIVGIGDPNESALPIQPTVGFYVAEIGDAYFSAFAMTGQFNTATPPISDAAPAPTVFSDIRWSGFSPSDNLVLADGGTLVLSQTSVQFGDLVTTPLPGTITGAQIVGLDATPVPEPASLALLGVGLAGLGLARRRR